MRHATYYVHGCACCADLAHEVVKEKPQVTFEELWRALTSSGVVKDTEKGKLLMGTAYQAGRYYKGERTST